MTDESAWLEKRDAERQPTRLQIKFKEIPRSEADAIASTGDFSDVFASANLQDDSPDLKDAFTENISVNGVRLAGDIRLIGGKSMAQGTHLMVEIIVPDAPMPVHALAQVIWCEVDEKDKNQFHAGLFFVGINKQDVTKVARFLVLQRRAKQ